MNNTFLFRLQKRVAIFTTASLNEITFHFEKKKKNRDSTSDFYKITT